MAPWKTIQSSIIGVGVIIGGIGISWAVAYAFDASSTNFFIRGDIGIIGGQGTSTSFSTRQDIGQPAGGLGTSASFQLGAGGIFNLFRSVRPQYEQIHIHWRNDDGSESGATSATGGVEDAGLSNLAKNTTKRLRIEIANTGGTKYGYAAQQLRLEYGLLSGTCAAASYTDVGAGGGDWDMATSQLTEAGNTTNISVGTGGTTDSNAFFLGTNGGQRETTSQTGALSVSSEQFVELEYAVQALSSATDGGTYCFRVTNAGTATDFLYTRYATTTISGGNAAPVVSAVSVNDGNPITLIPNTTTSVSVHFTVTDTNGCSDVFTGGAVTSTLFRSGVTAACAASNLSCYITGSVTHNCSGGSSAQATTTLALYYFADATDASSTYPSDTWQASISVRDTAGATSTASSSGVELNTLTAINVPTASLNYGTLSPSTNTGGTNQNATTTNAGNSSTTLQLSSLATLTSGANSISTSSQHYASSTFTYGGGEQALSGTAATVSGFTLTSPTSTTNVARSTFWGIAIPAATPTGTYSGTNVFSALFVP
jgi:hypothetical protein